MGKGDKYTDEQLAEMYRHYARLKGWNTDDETVNMKVEGWRYNSIGPVGLAIDFHETGKDNAKHLGKDAEIESQRPETQAPKQGCIGAVIFLFVVLVLYLTF